MNWDEGSPQGVKVSTWDKVASGGSKEVLPLDKETNVRPLSLFSTAKDGKYELVEFTSEVSVAFYLLYTSYYGHHIYIF
jgi:hypothetical protein